MHVHTRLAALAIIASFTTAPAAQEAPAANCKTIHADLVEDISTTECRPGHSSCYLGTVDGNQGLRGTTYFRSDGFVVGPPTAPGWLLYSGGFEYVTPRGTIVMREVGAFNATRNNPESGSTSAVQKIVDATGEFTGSTGQFFVYGFNVNGHVVTKISGQICTP